MTTEQNLETLLENFGIPVSKWGTGDAKTLTHLVNEINNLETELLEEKGKLVRKVTVAYMNVYYTDKKGNTYKLVEDRQEFHDGRIRRRPYLQGSIAEKLTYGERPDETAKRALSEELGIEETGQIYFETATEETKDSPSYPGLQTQFFNYIFETTLPEDKVKKEGYVEEQEDKTTYWTWKEVKE